jgi:hypothetical protein
MMARASSMACTPTVPRASAASLGTADLRAELKCCRSGEVGRTTIKCYNLDGDFDTANAAPIGQAAHTPTSLGCGGGCMVLASYLRMVVWWCKFQPHLLEKYNGNINPAEFLQIYSTSILAIGGNEVIMANYFPMALTGTTQSWLMNLPPGSLYSWEEMCRQFKANFESTYARLGNEVDLHAMH